MRCEVEAEVEVEIEVLNLSLNLSLFASFHFILKFTSVTGGLAQLARACDWQSQGQGFDSPNLHLRPP